MPFSERKIKNNCISGALYILQQLRFQTRTAATYLSILVIMRQGFGCISTHARRQVITLRSCLRSQREQINYLLVTIYYLATAAQQCLIESPPRREMFHETPYGGSGGVYQGRIDPSWPIYHPLISPLCVG